MAIDNCSADVDPALIEALILTHDALEEAEDVLDDAANAATEADNTLDQAQLICGNVPTLACQTLIAVATADSIAAHQVLAIVSVIYQNALDAYTAAQDALEIAAANATITITSNYNPGDIFALGETTVIYTATDGAGNTSTCSFVVTVIDEELPTLTCPPNVVFTSIPTQCYGNAFVGLPTDLADNCGIDQDPMNSFNWGHNASGNYPVGVTTVIWSIEDINGNVGTCSMTVTILDVEPPTIVFCPEDTTLTLPYTDFYDYYTVTEPGVCEANITIAPLEAWDNCGVLSIVNDYTGTDDASGIYPQGQTVVTWTVTDIWDNTSTCATVVFVHDNQAPTITCPAPVSVCTADCTNNATGQYIEPPLPTFTDNCSIQVIANSFTNIAGATALYPSGFIYSGNGTYPIGTTTVVWTIVDVSGNTNSCSTSVTVEKCCQSEAGLLTVSGAQCPFDPIVGTATGFATSNNAVACTNPADDYTQSYLVVSNTTGLIVAINNTGTFDALGANGLAAGNYTMFSYNQGTINAPDPTPSVGLAISEIGEDNTGCFDLSSGVSFAIPDAFPAEPLMTSVTQGTGIITTFYNVVQLEVFGGTQPYNYNWANVAGYVQSVVNVNNQTNGVIITVVYADNASWDLSVTDANGCSDTALQFSNAPDENNPSAFLDIYDYTIVSASSGQTNGSVTVYVEGGLPCGAGNNQYQYSWSGPSIWTNPNNGAVSGGNTQTLTALPSGWYTLTVTDCGGQETVGWFWVPKQVRGRGKLADGQNLIAYPNPFSSETTIEFTVSETSNTTLVLYTLDGKQVATLFKGNAIADELYSIPFTSNNIATGMYIAELKTSSGASEHYKLMLSDR